MGYIKKINTYSTLSKAFPLIRNDDSTRILDQTTKHRND